MDVSGAFSAVPGIVDVNEYSYKENTFYPDTKGNHNANLQKELYNNYSYIVSVVNEAFETAADIVYNTYHKWIEFKSANPEKYKKILGMIQDYRIKHDNSFWMTGRTSIEMPKHSEELHKTWNFGLFYDLMRTYSGYRLDIPDLLDRASYFDTVNEYRKRLMDSDRNIDNKYISFDVENSYEFMSAHLGCLNHDTVCIKVRPNLTTDEKFNTLGATYRVYIDIGSIVNAIIYETLCLWQDPDQVKNSANIARENNQKEPITEDDMLDKDNFRTKVLFFFKDYFEKVAKHICIEVLDTSITIRNGWSFFLKKFDNMHAKVLQSDAYTRLNSFLKGLTRYKSGNIIDMDSEKYANTFSQFIRMSMTSYERSLLPIIDDNRFLESLLSSMRYEYDGYTIDRKRTIENIVCVMFFRAFSIYFESTSNISLIEYYTEWNHIKSYYAREFDRDYDFEALHTATQAVDDYVCKDFFKSLYANYNNYKRVIYDNAKFKNGEKLSFMFAKFKRKLWMAYAAEMHAIFDIKLKFEAALKNYSAGLNDDTDGAHKFKEMFNDFYNKVLERLISNFSYNSGSCGYMEGNKIPSKPGRFTTEYHLIDNHFQCHLANMAWEMAAKGFNRAIQTLSWVDDMVRLISEWNGQKNDTDRVVISYNAPENAEFIENDYKTPDQIVKNEFKRQMFDIGLLDFETTSYY